MQKKLRKEVAVAPRIDSDTAEWYDANWPSRNAGVSVAIELLPHMHRAALAEMRGKFHSGELGMILDVMNGTAGIMIYGHGGLAGQHVGLNVADSFELYPGVYEEKWGIDDPAGFLKRLASITRFQAVALEIWAAAFWEKHYEAVELHEYCRPLL